MHLLNEGCKFCCTGNQSLLITVSEKGNTIAKDYHRRILTDKAKCEAKTPLPCSFLTAMAGGTPTNCQLMQTQWTETNSKIQCNGNNVLTSLSTMMCIYGGKIRPLGTSCITKIGKLAGVRDISECSCEEKGTVAKEDVAIGIGKNTEIENPAQNESAKAESESSVIVKSEPAYASHTMCDYENCSERESCKYFNSQIYVENNSTKLRDNFQIDRQEEWDRYWVLHQEQNANAQNRGWRIAAHHLISGNQVLMMKDDQGNLLYGTLVKLINYFDYDVNNAWNCIMLPTNESEFGRLEQIEKSASAYDAMGMMGRQWHAGGHEYTLDSDTLQNLALFYRKHPDQYPMQGNPVFFSNYKTAMKEEMDRLLLRYSRKQCWKKDFYKKKERFFACMDGITSRIEQYLLAFGENPRKSFPFFVSKVAVEYAYDLPATVKLIVIYGKGTQIRAKRLRLERYLKNALKIVPVEKADIEIKDNDQFILFCENVMHFLIDSSLEEYSLPFSQSAVIKPAIRRIDFAGEKIMEYINDHSNELMAFISQNEYAYQPSAKIVSMRRG